MEQGSGKKKSKNGFEKNEIKTRRNKKQIKRKQDNGKTKNGLK